MRSISFPPIGESDSNGFRKLVIDIVSSVLDGNGAAAFSVCNNSDRLSAVTAKGEEESVEFFIVGFDGFDDILFAFNSIFQIHFIT